MYVARTHCPVGKIGTTRPRATRNETLVQPLDSIPRLTPFSLPLSLLCFAPRSNSYAESIVLLDGIMRYNDTLECIEHHNLLFDAMGRNTSGIPIYACSGSDSVEHVFGNYGKSELINPMNNYGDWKGEELENARHAAMCQAVRECETMCYMGTGGCRESGARYAACLILSCLLILMMMKKKAKHEQHGVVVSRNAMQ